MRARLLRAALAFAPTLALVLGVAGDAAAHFRLEQPADALVTDANGDPVGTGGTQKTNPCGEGQPSGVVTKVHAGSTLHLRLVETVPHGGHYRVAVVPKLDPASADLPEPAVTLVAGQCDSAAIASPVVAPIVADGLFPHTQAEAVTGQVWETDVPIPQHVGSATLQVIELMTPHAPPCFYHHCAVLDVVTPDTVIGGDAGASDAGVDDQPILPHAESSGCSVARDARADGDPPSPTFLGSALLLGLVAIRRGATLRAARAPRRRTGERGGARRSS